MQKAFAGAKNGARNIADAARWAEVIVKREYEGPGYMSRAIEKAARRTGVDRGVFWKLRYRTPKTLCVSVYFTLKAAYEADCERLERLGDAERPNIRTKTNAVAKGFITAGDVLARQKDG